MADATQQTGADDLTFESSANRTYPLCPEGVQRVIVDKATFEMRDPHPQAKSPDKVPTLSLWLSTLDAKYEDPKTKEMRPHRLFYSMKITDHEKGKMLPFCQKVLGTGLPMKEQKNAAGDMENRIYLGPKTVIKKEDGPDEIHFKQFENLEFSVLVAHKIRDDKTKKDGIESVVACSPESKSLNLKLFQTV